MSFLSLYRKYRPENFSDLIGQDQVKKTLKNALKNDRVSHAYLFAGPRGTGKTSAAKVFAKSLNCENPSADFEPCEECSSCQRIKKGNSLDVIEIDAASNRGIDEIRELREKVKFYPGEGKYKVYIIDEVHMLTKGAFNALLKTLEEPPESVVFILATTEPHEVITTIMSRCQRFDFSLLTLNNLKKRLQYIAEAEGYQIESEALDILARSARGGMRDAISLLDQAISFSDGHLNAESIASMLGRIDRSDLKEFLIYLSKEESQSALELLDKQLESGLGIERFSDELIEYCRELLLIKECGLESGILEYSRSYLEEIAAAASNLSTKKISNIIDEFASLKEKLRSSARPRLQLEISVIKLSSRVKSDPLEARFAELEFKLNNLLNKNENSDFKEEIQTKKAKYKDNVEVKSNSVNKDTKDTDSAADKKIDSTKDTVKQKQTDNTKRNTSVKKEKNNILSLVQIKENWARVLNETRQLDISVQALLREGEPAAVSGETVIIAFPETKKFHYKGAASNKALILRALRDVLGQPVEVEFQLGAKKKELNELHQQAKQQNNFTADTTFDSNVENQIKKKQQQAVNKKNNDQTTANENQAKADFDSQASNQNDKEADDLDIETLARIFSGEIVEINQSILENKGGN